MYVPNIMFVGLLIYTLCSGQACWKQQCPRDTPPWPNAYKYRGSWR